MDIYVSNQWTHGFLDTQQKNISLVYSVEIFSIKALWVCLFKSVDTWTPGHTTKQYLSSVKSSGIYIYMFQISGHMDFRTHCKKHILVEKNQVIFSQKAL